MTNLFRKSTAFLMLLILAAVLTSCSEVDDPQPVPKPFTIEGNTYTRFDNEAPQGKVYQVMEFKANGQGRTDYRIDKKTIYVPIVEFTYRYNPESIWITTTRGNSDKYVQEARFVGDNILIGGQMYYLEK